MVATLAREVAWTCLRSVDQDQAYSNLVLPAMLRDAWLSSRDSALTTELVQGTLRRRGTYDAVLDFLSKHGVDALDPAVCDVLRLGAHQLLAMRIPTHAAVSTSVALTRKQIGHKPTGLVNAILRRVAERSLEQWVQTLTTGMDEREAQSIEFSHPRWMIDAFSAALNHDQDQLEALMKRNNEPPPVTLVARPGLCDPAELPGTAGTVSPYAKRLGSGDPAKVAAVRDGKAGVQDEGSQAVALALAHASLTQTNSEPEHWLDLCAGPGGKTALLGAIAEQTSATLTANEPQSHRAELVRKTVRQLPNVIVTEYDGREGPWESGAFDRVLVDAPCTGLGALRRRPEARWRRTPEDVDSLVPLQKALLARAIDVTRPGGVIAYATCSPHVAETADVVAAAEHVDIATVQRWWPHIHDTDAMYVAILTRRAGD